MKEIKETMDTLHQRPNPNHVFNTKIPARPSPTKIYKRADVATLAKLLAQLPTHSFGTYRMSLSMDPCVNLAGTNQHLAESELEMSSHSTCILTPYTHTSASLHYQTFTSTHHSTLHINCNQN